MSDESASTPPPSSSSSGPDERRSTFLRRAVSPGRRGTDGSLRRWGLAGVLAIGLLAMVRETLKSEREDRRLDRVALIAAQREQTDAIRAGFVSQTSALGTIETRFAGVEDTLAWLRGAATGRLRCPDVTCPKCPTCPTAPACPSGPTVVVSTPPSSSPSSSPAPAPPASSSSPAPRRGDKW